MKVREVSCTTALSPTKLPGLSYAVNPYRGCAIACVYCYAPSVLREARPWGRFVDVKRNMPAVLAKEVRRGVRGVVGIGTVTDGYQALERRYHVTRYCLEVLARARWPVSIQTKSSLVLRDLDLLRSLDDVEVGVTITTLDETMRRAFEPFASPAQRRLDTLRRLNAARVRTWAFVGPILPLATEHTLVALLRGIREAGTTHVMYDPLRFRPGIWERVEPAAASVDLVDAYRTARDKPESFDRTEKEMERVGRELGLRVEPAFPGGW
jgi:DNA repair photolyase